MAGRSGRRPGSADSRPSILAAARESFATTGYTGTTIRQVATAAGVDPALIHYFFGSKDRLFTAAMEIPVDLTEQLQPVLDGAPDQLGERFARLYLGLWEDESTGPALLSLFRSTTTHEPAARMVREFISERLLGSIAAALEPVHSPGSGPGGAPVALRVQLAGSHLLGLAIARYIVRIEPLASTPLDEVVDLTAGTIQHYLTGPSQT